MRTKLDSVLDMDNYGTIPGNSAEDLPRPPTRSLCYVSLVVYRPCCLRVARLLWTKLLGC